MPSRQLPEMRKAFVEISRRAYENAGAFTLPQDVAATATGLLVVAEARRVQVRACPLTASTCARALYRELALQECPVAFGAARAAVLAVSVSSRRAKIHG